MRPRQELYSNSGMNSRLEQPAVRKSVRKGALFVCLYGGEARIFETALRTTALVDSPPRTARCAVCSAPSTSQSYAVGAPQGTDGSGIFPVSRHRHGRPSSGGREHGEPDCWPRFQATGCAGGFPASQGGKAVRDSSHRCCAKLRACPHRVPVHFVRTPSGGWLRPAL